MRTIGGLSNAAEREVAVPAAKQRGGRGKEAGLFACSAPSDMQFYCVSRALFQLILRETRRALCWLGQGEGIVSVRRAGRGCLCKSSKVAKAAGQEAAMATRLGRALENLVSSTLAARPASRSRFPLLAQHTLHSDHRLL